MPNRNRDDNPFRAGLAAALLVLTGGCFYAADQGRKLEEKILRIEHDQVDPRRFDKQMADFQTRDEQYRADIDALRKTIQEQTQLLEQIRQTQEAGMMERSVLENRVQQVEEWLKQEQARLAALERAAPGSKAPKKTGATEMGASITPSVASSVPQGNDAFTMIMASIQAGEWVKAKEAIDAVLARDPAPREKAQAQLLNGHLHFRQKAYSDAILAFDEVAKKFPDFPEAAEALYFEGRSFLEKGTKDTAIAFYKKLIKRYPESPFRNKAQADLKQIETGQ